VSDFRFDENESCSISQKYFVEMEGSQGSFALSTSCPGNVVRWLFLKLLFHPLRVNF
jgi:hypothetical protein